MVGLCVCWSNDAGDGATVGTKFGVFPVQIFDPAGDVSPFGQALQVPAAQVVEYELASQLKKQALAEVEAVLAVVQLAEHWEHAVVDSDAKAL